MILQDEPPGQKMSSVLLGKRGRQIQIAPESMKQLSQSKNNVQFFQWVLGTIGPSKHPFPTAQEMMCLVVKVKSNGANNTIA